MYLTSSFKAITISKIKTNETCSIHCQPPFDLFPRRISIETGLLLPGRRLTTYRYDSTNSIHYCISISFSICSHYITSNTCSSTHFSSNKNQPCYTARLISMIAIPVFSFSILPGNTGLPLSQVPQTIQWGWPT